jgi:hypothetical protein
MHSGFGSLEGSIYDTLYVARVSQMPRAAETRPDLYDAGRSRDVSREVFENDVPAQMPELDLKSGLDSGR